MHLRVESALNFLGNHATTPDPSIAVVPGFWLGSRDWSEEVAARAGDELSWSVRIPLERGYAVATMHYADVQPDSYLQTDKGVLGLFHSKEERAAPDLWGR